jgi:hypothetical protein
MSELASHKDGVPLESIAREDLIVRYRRGKSGFGRGFVVGALGLTSFAKKVRNTFIHDSCRDADMNNGHPRLTVNLCEANNIPCGTIKHYIENREQLLQDIANTYGVKRKDAKRLMLRLCFGGAVKNWKEEENINVEKDLPFLEEFSKQLKDIAEDFKKHNEAFYEMCRAKKEAKKKRIF